MAHNCKSLQSASEIYLSKSIINSRKYIIEKSNKRFLFAQLFKKKAVTPNPINDWNASSRSHSSEDHLLNIANQILSPPQHTQYESGEYTFRQTEQPQTHTPTGLPTITPDITAAFEQLWSIIKTNRAYCLGRQNISRLKLIQMLSDHSAAAAELTHRIHNSSEPDFQTFIQEMDLLSSIQTLDTSQIRHLIIPSEIESLGCSLKTSVAPTRESSALQYRFGFRGTFGNQVQPLAEPFARVGDPPTFQGFVPYLPPFPLFEVNATVDPPDDPDPPIQSGNDPNSSDKNESFKNRLFWSYDDDDDSNYHKVNNPPG